MGTWPYTFARLEIGGEITPDAEREIMETLAPSSPAREGLPTPTGWGASGELTPPEAVEAAAGTGPVEMTNPWVSPEAAERLVGVLTETGAAFRLTLDGNESADASDPPAELHGTTVWCLGNDADVRTSVGCRHDPRGVDSAGLDPSYVEWNYGPETLPALVRSEPVSTPGP